ncbi:MAG: DUF975 family protein [Eubacteriaceae bacterium]
MKTRQEIKEIAKFEFFNNYWLCVGALVLYFLANAIAGSITYGIGTIFLLPPLLVGISYFSLTIYRGESCSIEGMFSKGFSNYGRTLGGILWMQLFIFLWALLLVIPGIIKGYAYSMAPYILADCPKVSATDALKISMRMTNGYKWDIFVMYLSFIGWMILNGFTLGILGLFYTNPYISISLAGLYDELKFNALRNGVIDPSELA